jgi:hypothetical protein
MRRSAKSRAFASRSRTPGTTPTTAPEDAASTGGEYTDEREADGSLKRSAASDAEAASDVAGGGAEWEAEERLGSDWGGWDGWESIAPP